MPVYLCQAGEGHAEPWKSGVQVYASPFKVESSHKSTSSEDERNLAVASGAGDGDQNNDRNNYSQPAPVAVGRGMGTVVRRVRHREVLLVDDVCIAFNRYWLRVRWPGRKGGFAGYVAMGTVKETIPRFPIVSGAPNQLQLEDQGVSEDAENDETREETGSMPPSEPSEVSSLVCSRTGLIFPSSPAMSLQEQYDDAIYPPVSLAPLPTESVFCRICREGLHDDADDSLPAAAEDEVDVKGSRRESKTSELNEAVESITVPEAAVDLKGPVSPPPKYFGNTEATQNPMLAPCECSGSMKFVHYMCVEQWRCRSVHPAANQGLNCETCGGRYALPRPTQREVSMPNIEQDQDDWLEAMPPHVMQALRNPHVWWRIGANVVRQRWLRPIAPVVMSPIVALYCRARRLLKKRGVARRRWACSLCRRRARWKCVRCLRSYYCSRQCQNVSWHIIHKHVCYKPARFWGSVVMYSVLAFVLFPGIRTDPLMYDLGLLSVPASFIVMGNLGGSFGMFFKKATGIDARGRLLELAVVLGTVFLTLITWGLIQAFFGSESACFGVIGSYDISKEDLESSSSMVGMFRLCVLTPMKIIYLFLDRACLRYSGSWLRRLLCDRRSLLNFFPLEDEQGYTRDGVEGCFEHIPFANDGFFLQEHRGQECAGDLVMVLGLYHIAALSFIASALAKQRERRQRQERMDRRIPRQARMAPLRRPHQD